MTPPDDTRDTPASESGTGTDITRTLDPDYEAILAAVTETARGRWFLHEYARRNRTADTKTLLSALNRLQRSLDRLPPPEPAAPTGLVADLRARVAELADAVGRARIEIAAVPRYGEGGAEHHDAGGIDFLAESETGRAAVLAAHESAERIQEIVWNLRERDVSGELCEIIDRHAVDIQAACRSGTVALKGMDAMGRGLRQLEARIADLAGLLSRLPEGPPEESPTPDIFADDPALGRFIEDIEIIDVEEVGWHGPDHGGSGSDIDLMESDGPEGESESASPAEPPPSPEAASAAETPPRADDDDVIFDDADAAGAEPLAGGSTYAPPLDDDDDTVFADVEDDSADENAVEAPRDVAMVDVGATDAPRPTEEPDTVATLPEPARTSERGGGDPPADLTGLTFDQKMILFS